MKLFSGRYTLPLLTLCLLALTPPALANPVTTAMIEDARTRVTTDAGLSEEDRNTLLNRLNTAEEELASAAGFRERTASMRAEQDQASQRSAEFEQRLQDAQAAPPDPYAGISADDPLKMLESELALATTQRQSLLARRQQLLDDTEGEARRRAEIRDRLVRLQGIINDAPPDDTAAFADPSAEVARLTGLARKQAALAEQEALETEIATGPARASINSSERAWLGLAISQADNRVAAIQEALSAASARATQEQLDTVSRLQENLQLDDPRVTAFAEENLRLATRLQEISTQMELTRREGQSIQALLNGISQDAQLMKRRLQAAGRKESLGRVMISRLDSLPETPALKRSISQRNELIAEVSLEQIDIEEAFRELNANREQQLEMYREFDRMNPEAQAWVRGLVQQRVQLLDKNLTDLGNLLRLLLDNNDMSTELVTATDEFHRFLLGNLLWVRTFTFLQAELLYEQLAIISTPENWLGLPGQVIDGYNALGWSPILLIAIILSFLLRWRLRPMYVALLSRPVRLSESSLWNILAGLLMTFALVAPWPLTLYVLGLHIDATPRDTAFSAAVGPALIYLARVLYALLFIRLIANRISVGRRYLKWDSRMLDQVRKELNWAGPLFCLALFINLFAYHLDQGASGGPLGAISTATCAITAIVVSLRLLYSDAFSEASYVRLALKMLILVAALVVLMQSMGLLFAAELYMVSLVRSVLALLAIKTVSDTLERWLLILRARMQREARLRQRSGDDAATAEDPDEQLDLVSLSDAHAKLLAMVRLVATIAVLWILWSPSLPAFNLLESVTLWSVTDTAYPGSIREITLFNLLYSALILVVTVLITRNLPSLNEVFMREWFNMSAGARYASSILMQYLVIAVGASIFLANIGWEWGKLQWLVAALGVGIGFGLQEIVANFISGIIILFERPVRVGDLISVGGAEGEVKKITPRATIIETFDHKELLIPNKELITGQVINWTLSDGAVRVIIPVGIAYGSDVRRALALLLEAASEVPNVLPEPEPRASFEDFGDNALVIWLRCYVADDRVGTWTELRTVINDKFANAGITISFPQRDVHLDTLEPLQVEVRHLSEPAPQG